MYTMENYFWGLIGYAVGAAFVMWYLVWLCGHIPLRHLRNFLIMLFAALLFTPVRAYTDGVYLAPAFVVAVFEGLLSSAEGGTMARALRPMGFVFGAMLVGYTGWQFWRASRQKGEKSPQPET